MTQSSAGGDSPQQLTEHIDDWRTPELMIDRGQRLVRHVALTGPRSRNGYHYTEQALREALPLYDGKPVFLDHASNVARPYDRSTRDLAGSIVHPRFENGRVRGDIQLLETDAGRTLLALAAANRPAVGMSHVVLAQKSADQSTVEKIHDVVSVDAVVFPATTSTFREQFAADPDNMPAAAIEALIDECELQHHQVQMLREERDDALRRLDALQQAADSQTARREVEQLLQEAGMPEWAITPLWRQQLLAAEDHAARQQLLADRRALLDRLSVQPPVSRERLDRPGPHSDAAVIAVLKPQRRTVLSGIA